MANFGHDRTKSGRKMCIIHVPLRFYGQFKWFKESTNQMV